MAIRSTCVDQLWKTFAVQLALRMVRSWFDSSFRSSQSVCCFQSTRKDRVLSTVAQSNHFREFVFPTERNEPKIGSVNHRHWKFFDRQADQQPRFQHLANKKSHENILIKQKTMFRHFQYIKLRTVWRSLISVTVTIECLNLNQG